MIRSDGRRKRAIEHLATALTECFEESTESVRTELKADRAEMGSRLDRQGESLREMGSRLDRQDESLREVGSRLDRQDDTLRMVWTQCGGNQNQRLPVDD